jgi:hypothetical protein
LKAPFGAGAGDGFAIGAAGFAGDDVTDAMTGAWLGAEGIGAFADAGGGSGGGGS